MDPVYCVFTIRQTEHACFEALKGIFTSFDLANQYCINFNNKRRVKGWSYLPIIQNTRFKAACLFTLGECLVIEPIVPIQGFN